VSFMLFKFAPEGNEARIAEQVRHLVLLRLSKSPSRTLGLSWLMSLGKVWHFGVFAAPAT
jgi:hypothetical protein